MTGSVARTVGGLLLAIGVTSCAGSGDPPDTGPAGSTTFSAVAVVDHLDVTAREPMLVEHPGGRLFVAGYGRVPPDVEQQPRLWRSDDGGASWVRVDVGPLESGAIGNSDVDLTVGPDGTLYFAQMGFDRTTAEGTHIAIGISHDAGESWTWTMLSQTRLADRPWVRVTPSGTAHVIWNDGSGVAHRVSRDSGRTWQRLPRIHDRGGSSHFAVGPAGELAVRLCPISASGNRFDPDMDRLAISLDDGGTWSVHDPPGRREWSPDLGATDGVPRWVEPVAWDDDGDLFLVWSEGRQLWVARSEDRGASWESRSMADGDDVVYFPYLAAHGSGELAVTAFSGRGETLRAHVWRVDFPRGVTRPRVVPSAEIVPDAWAISGENRMRDAAGEYVPVAFLSDGSLGVVVPIQDEPRGGFSWRRYASLPAEP